MSLQQQTVPDNDQMQQVTIKARCINIMLLYTTYIQCHQLIMHTNYYCNAVSKVCIRDQNDLNFRTVRKSMVIFGSKDQGSMSKDHRVRLAWICISRYPFYISLMHLVSAFNPAVEDVHCS